MFCVLHNICRQYGIPDPALPHNDEEEVDIDEEEENEIGDGEDVRNRFILDFFQ